MFVLKCKTIDRDRCWEYTRYAHVHPWYLVDAAQKDGWTVRSVILCPACTRAQQRRKR